MNHYAFVETNFLWSTIKLTFQRGVKCDGYHVLKALPGCWNNFKLRLFPAVYVQRWFEEEPNPASVLFAWVTHSFGRVIMWTDIAKGFSARLDMPGWKGEWTLLMETSRSFGWKTLDSCNLLKFLQLLQRIIVQNLVFTVQFKVGILTFHGRQNINFLLLMVRKRALFSHSSFFLSFFLNFLP